MSVYKSEQANLLDRALHSIWMDQTLKPDQIILIEDGPLGNELHNVINEWKKNLPGIMDIIVNPENLGLTKSLNRGIPLAKGEYIARMDSDDISTPERFEKQVAYLEANPEISALSGNVEIYDERGSFLYTKKFPLTHQECYKRISKGSPLSHPCVMIRKKVFEDGIRYNEKYRTSQDIALWFDMLANGCKIANLDIPLLKFEYDQNMYKRRSHEKAKNEFEIYVKGIKKLYGLFTWRYAYPIARYIFRSLPQPFIKLIYNSQLKNKYI
ncbi:MAG: glycosyltransferase [Roseburia sp.]|nr:glycosyltransferase [Roseburia sp.]